MDCDKCRLTSYNNFIFAERNNALCRGHEITSLFGIQGEWFEINNKL